MIHILPIVDASNSLYYQTLTFANTAGVDSSSITLEKCREVIIAYVAANLATKFKWIEFEIESNNIPALSDMIRSFSPHAEKDSLKLSARDEEHFIKAFVDKLIYPEVEIARATARLFNWFVTDQTICGKNNLTPEENLAITLSEEYTSTILDNAWDMTMCMIECAIPTPTWQVWQVRCMGKDLYLHAYEDYRIKDWERRVSKNQ